MAADVSFGEKFTLSLTGQLQLQERKDKKDRKGRITFKKKTSYWFWFDDKECCLKYYKNSQTYYSHLHKHDGKIELTSAKVSPSEVYQDSVGSVSIDPDVVSNRTFIIFTNSGSMYALSADRDVTCHQWIRKLQEKRAEWEKRDHLKMKRSHSRDEIKNPREEGLVFSVDSKALKMSPSRSHVRQMFGDILGPDNVSVIRSESCPISHMPPQGLHPHHISYPHVVQLSAQDDNVTDGPGNVKRANTPDSTVSGVVQNEDNLGELQSLTDHERVNLKLQLELAEARLENEQLLQKIMFFEDEKKKQFQQKIEMANEIQELMESNHKLKASAPIENLHNENENLRDVIKKLKRSLGSVDGEVELCKTKLAEREKRIQEANKKIRELEDELLRFKALYVSLLDWSFQIPTPGPGGSPIDESDPVEEKLKDDLLKLIHVESAADNSLVDISGDQSVFEDQFGEFHDWKNDSNICHFLCRQLYLHYTQYNQDSTMQEWYNYTKSLKPTKDGCWEIPSESSRGKRRELRGYLRRGVPQPMRSNMWASLVYSYVGKMRDVMNSTAPGNNYYESLLHTSSPYKKQILLDLYRTMPSNKYFRLEGLGAKKLERVLMAYSNHNKNVGYCQGMNMICAAGLLFLDEESAFWYLVTIIEKLMPQHYFANGLAAAQADQAVMKALVEDKLPSLSNHLEVNGIDVTVVSFNWFITLFIDALPTESMLRVMDCFLLEGRKVFFRFSLAIFKIHERRVLSFHDPVTIFQFIKEVARHIFNVEALFKTAFTELEPFPSRSAIQTRIKPHLEKFLSDWKARETYKKSNSPVQSISAPLVSPAISKQRKQLLWECGVIIDSDEVWLCCGERQTGKICVIKSSDEGLDVTSPKLNVGSKILCIKAFCDDIVMIGTLDFYIHAICTKERTELWSMKMNDSVLDFVGYQNNIICALADGYIAAISITSDRSSPNSDPILYRIGSTAVQCISISPFNHVWVGCGKAITILEARSYEPVKAIVIPDSAGKVYKMEQSSHGIWVTFKTSTLVYLYDSQYMVKILAVDYTTFLPSQTEFKLSQNMDDRITVIMVNKDTLWIGTGSASFHTFKICSTTSKPDEQKRQLEKLKQKSVGRFERTVSQSLIIRGRNSETDEGLVNEPDLTRTIGPAAQRSKLDDNSAEENQDRRNSDRLLNRQAFGRTFYRRIRRDNPSITDLKRDGLYELKHLWSDDIDHGEKECPKVTTVKPITTSNGRCLIISCINATTKFEKAVQLWQPDFQGSSSWNCKFLEDCYEVVSKHTRQQLMARPRSIERSRAYSTMLGSHVPAEPMELSSPLLELDSN